LKKLFAILFLAISLLCSYQNSVFAIGIESESANRIDTKTMKFIRYTYDNISFNKMNKLRFEPFMFAYYGYLNLIEAGKINSNSLLTVCDFTQSSNEKRLWVIDLAKKKVLFNTLVAHGMGTGEEFANTFSNIENSHQSSLGFYTTGETYEGNNGYSLKLNGVDGMFNSNAYDRAIVIHGANYVCEEFARANKRIGRSHGCPALPVDIAPKVIDKIKDGQCLFIYFSAESYFHSSYWLTKKVKNLPEEADQMDINLPANRKYARTNNEAQEDDCAATECKPATTRNNRIATNNSTSNSALVNGDKSSLPLTEKKVTSYIFMKEQSNHTFISDTVQVK
jgi:hypothetical protein